MTRRRVAQYRARRLQETVGASCDVLAAAIDPGDRERSADRWAEALATGMIFESEARMRGADNRYRWFLSRGLPIHDASGAIGQWFGASTDITALKQAEIALRRSEHRLQKAIDIETVGVINFRTGGAITFANDAFLRMSGYDRADVERGLARWDAMTPPDWMPRARQAIDELAASHGAGNDRRRAVANARRCYRLRRQAGGRVARRPHR